MCQSIVILTFSVTSNQIFVIFTTDWIKEYGEMPSGTVILHHYKEYMELISLFLNL